MLLVLPIGYFNIVSTFAIRTATTWQADNESATLRVMTWNVQNFVNNLRKESAAEYADSKEGILKTIHDYNPYVFCIQEYRNTENAKRRPPIRKELDSLGYKYYYCSNDRVTPLARNKKAIVTEGVAIYSRLPLLDSGRININNVDKNENLVYADVLFNNKPVRIFTAHLQSFYIYQDTAAKYDDENIYEITYKEKSAASYKIRETEINHEAEVKIIRKAIEASPYPVIYCGDMNITPTSYNYRLLRGNNLQDAFLEKGSGIGNTFYKIGPTLRIDVCLPDTAMQVLQCKREAKKLSDHYPVIADLQWK
ncbi:endonuclease/exonuclease/phosphatase family protein [soil metagenome]